MYFLITFVFVGNKCYMCTENVFSADICFKFNKSGNCNSFLFVSMLYNVGCTALMEFAIFKYSRHLAVLPTVRLH
jgi:hypothetical protein